ncbi:MAG: hypothetical protein ACTHM9_01485 [Gemmatimonadales bacterium]
MRRLPLVGLTGLLLLAACDKVRLPGLPAPPSSDTLASATPKAAPKPAAAARRASALDRASAVRRLDGLRSGLRRLVVAEETYYAENGVYTDDLSRLGYRNESGTEVRFLWATRGDWAAQATAEDLPDRDCVVYVGRGHSPPMTSHDRRPGQEGSPVCDAIPIRRSPATAAAPAPSPSPSAPVASSRGTTIPDTGSALDAVDPAIQMRVDLRNLVRSQDTYFGTQGTYSRRFEPFALQYLWHRGVTISILSANDASWSARAAHVARPGRSCVIWVGPVEQRPTTDAQKRSSDRPNAPVCDD